MNKNAKKVAIRGSVLLLMAVVMIAYYYYLSNKEKAAAESNPKVTAVKEVLMKDLVNDYPRSPKEVIRYYSELTKCFYNETYTSEELNALAEKARELYDEELLDNNEWGQHIIQLQVDVDAFKAKSMTVSSYVVAASTDVDYYALEGKDYAKLRCTYVLKENTVRQDIKELFVLRKDDKGHWKILGWDLVKNVENSTGEATNGGQ